LFGLFLFGLFLLGLFLLGRFLVKLPEVLPQPLEAQRPPDPGIMPQGP
jgi:hypothetical protein